MDEKLTREMLVAAIDGGARRFSDIHYAVGGSRKFRLRLVDAALQRARRAGVIRFTTGIGWEVVRP